MTNLTSLPLSVLSHILSFLGPSAPPGRKLGLPSRSGVNTSESWQRFSDPPVTLSLACAETMTLPLPTELLSPANASPILAAAVLHLLGSRVSYLTFCNTAGSLVPWLTTFAPHVKALSTRNPLEMWRLQRRFLPHIYPIDIPTDARCRRSIDLFSTLTIHIHGLVVLDLVDLSFPETAAMQDQFIAGLYAALESNAATLRELALPVFKDLYISETALQMVTLKHLQVLTIHYSPQSQFLSKKGIQTESQAQLDPIVRMMRAVDGHADRSRNLTTLTELHLKNLPQSPPALTSECSGVFSAVTTLKVSMNCGFRGVPELPDLDFLRGFTNLQRLFLRPYAHVNPLYFAKEKYWGVYSNLRELHICPMSWLTDISVAIQEVRWPSVHRSSITAMNSFFYKSNRNIRSLVLPRMNSERLQSVIASCPRLECLCLTIRYATLRRLGDLIRKCDQVKALDIFLKGDDEEGLDAQSWHDLSRAIPDSHRDLCQLGIYVALERQAPFTCVKAMIDCFVHIIETLGPSARRLAFRVNVKPWGLLTLMEGICRLLESCIHYSSALEVLYIDLSVEDHSFELGKFIRQVEFQRQITELQNKLLRVVPSLRVLDLGRSGFPDG